MTEAAAAAAADVNVDIDIEISPENVPLPRSSMITVRLSEVQLEPIIEDNTGQDVTHDPSLQSNPSSPRSSRSSSQTTDSSSSIETVDWDELEKTEEQEPKDEGTDEVRYESNPSRERSLRYIVDCSVTGTFRERKCSFGYRSQGRHYHSKSTPQEHTTHVGAPLEENDRWPTAAVHE